MRRKILIYANQYPTTVGQSIPYLDFFGKFGDVLLVTSENDLEFFIEHGDVLVLPGGMDVNPARYGTRPGYQMKEVNAHYEYLDEHLMMPWIETGKPIIGVCRGMQTLNVAMGGTLHRHIDGHIQSDKKERYDTPDKMYTMFDGYHIHEINSFHHQAVARLADGFEVLGWGPLYQGCPALSSKDLYRSYKFITQDNNKRKVMRTEAEHYPSVIEMMRHTALPYIAFQYHPEEFNCPLANLLIEETITTYEEAHNQPTEA